MGIGDVAKKLGEMWNNLSDSEKQPFLSKANKLKDKYQKVFGEKKTPVNMITVQELTSQMILIF